MPQLNSITVSCPISSIPTYMMGYRGFCGTTKVVYAALLHLCGASTSCAVTIWFIADYAGISYVQAQKHLKVLKKLELITVKHRWKESSIFTLHRHPMLNGDFKGCPPGRTRALLSCTSSRTSEEKAKKSKVCTLIQRNQEETRGLYSDTNLEPVDMNPVFDPPFPPPDGATEDDVKRATVLCRAAYYNCFKENK